MVRDVNDKIILSPILNNSVVMNGNKYHFKICFRCPVELRIIKEDISEYLKGKGFDVEVRDGWHE